MVAPVISAQFLLNRVRSLVSKPVVCVKFVIAAGIEKSAVKLVGATLSRDADDRTGCLAIFGAEELRTILNSAIVSTEG